MFEQQEFETKKLKEIANIGSSKRIYANEYKESGVPFYRSKEIRELGTGLKPSTELFISKEKSSSKRNEVNDDFFNFQYKFSKKYGKNNILCDKIQKENYE